MFCDFKSFKYFYSGIHICNLWKKISLVFHKSYYEGFLCKISIFANTTLMIFVPSLFAFTEMLLCDHEFHIVLLILICFMYYHIPLLFFLI
jgi:hypothetical protein